MIRLAPCLTLLMACHLPLAAEAMGGEAGWTSLFNGENLDGWTVKCRPADQDKTGYWKVVDGTITAETTPGSKHNYIWLLTEKEYGDFTFRLKVQTYSKSTGNSGIQVRSRYDNEAGWLDGPQVDIHPPGPWRNGFIYDETRGVQIWLWPNVGKPANAKPEHAPPGSMWFHADDGDVWNDIQVTCRGTRITTVVNGVTIADYDGAGRLDDEAHRSHNVGLKGQIGLQIHPGKELLIRFKDIEVKPIMKNSIFVIKPYKWNGMWVFDDERVGLDKEPFVAGADTMIDTAVQLKGIPKAEDGFLMVFSAGSFPDADFEIDWLRKEGGGNVYKGRFEIEGEVREMEGWLCPALNLYYPEAPKKLWVQVREVK